VKKTFTPFIIALLIATGAIGQNYRQAAGLRLGASGGITYRRLFDANAAGEIMLLGQNHGTAVVFLFEKQKPAVLFDDLNLNFIYGAGAHIGGASEEQCNNNDPYDNSYYYHGYNTMQLGVDGFASFEYLIPRYPIALSLECKPYFEFFDNHNFGIHLFVIAFGARYTF
jgi:hypothetical protein